MKVISHMTPAVAALYAGVAQAHPANAINEGASSFLAQFHAVQLNLSGASLKAA